MDQIDLSLDVPALCAKKLINKEVDIALVPIAVIPKLDNYRIISNYCIGCDGEVSTVCVYSNQPIEKLKRIGKDPNSKTSNALLRILLEKLGLSIELVDEVGAVGSNDGQLIIGNAAIRAKLDYAYEYDLGKAWKKLTGKPFVFAAWIAVIPLEQDFETAFDMALKSGYEQLQAVIDENSTMNHASFRVDHYLRKNISYDLDKYKQEAIDYFLQELKPRHT